MNKYVIFVAGVLEVPDCFFPNDRYIAAAAEMGYQVLVIGQEKIDPPSDGLLLDGLEIDGRLMEAIE